jgi:hypothetical protein
MAEGAGIEPAIAGLTVRCLTAWLPLRMVEVSAFPAMSVHGHDHVGAAAMLALGCMPRVPSQGRRRRLLTVVFFQVARKNTKSTLVTAESGAQVICEATTGSPGSRCGGSEARIARLFYTLDAWLSIPLVALP